MRHVGFVATLAALAWCASASAQSDRELATRQELIASAGDLSDQGKHAEALALAKRAAAIKMTTSLRLFLAREEAALGQLADAYGNGRQCAVEAEADARLNDRDRILAACKEIETSLGKRVGRITIKLPTPTPPNAHVTVSGDEVNAALLGTPYVVSAGKLTIVVTATGYLSYSADVDIPEGGSADVDVRLIADPNAQPCAEGQERIHGSCVATCTQGRVRTADASAQCCWPGQSSEQGACAGVRQCSGGLVARGEECVAPPSSPPEPTGLSPRAIAGIAIGSAGIVMAGIGAYFGATALSKNGDSAPYCDVGGVKNACYGQGVSLRSDAVHAATLSTILIGVGAASIIGGVTLWITAPSAKTSVGVGFDGRSMRLEGAF